MFSNIKHIVLILPMLMIKSIYIIEMLYPMIVQRCRNYEIVNGNSGSIVNNSCFYVSDFAF